MYDTQLLNGKRIIVTGASSGIGRATAILCAQLGAEVVLWGRNEARLEETAQSIGEKALMCIAQDLSEDVDLALIFNKLVSDGKKLDGLVHCAGIPCVMPVRGLTRKKLHEVMSTNFYSYVELVREFGKKKYSNDSASIVGISSAATSYPRANELGYIASKAAVEAATKVMAAEYGKRGIRVNCVLPGSVKTEMIKRAAMEVQSEEYVNRATKTAILGWQQPEQVASVCVFLLSDLSSAMTGSIVAADGGAQLLL